MSKRRPEYLANPVGVTLSVRGGSVCLVAPLPKNSAGAIVIPGVSQFPPILKQNPAGRSQGSSVEARIYV
jgi:hypothetical protein